MLVSTKRALPCGGEFGWYRGKLNRLSSQCGREVFVLDNRLWTMDHDGQSFIVHG